MKQCVCHEKIVKQAVEASPGHKVPFRSKVLAALPYLFNRTYY